MYARGEKSCRAERDPSSGGLEACYPRKFLTLGSRKCHFQLINTQENAVVSCLFYSSQVLSVSYSFYGKKKASDAIGITEYIKG